MSNEPDATQPSEPTYMVVGADGSTYGPADFATLKAWVADGRILPSTMLINEQTQVRLQARYIPGLIQESASVNAPPVSTGPVYQEPAARKSGTSPWVVAAIVAVAGCFGCGILGGAILFPVFQSSKHAAIKTNALSNMKQLSISVLMYAGDWDDKFPLRMESAMTFRAATEPYSKSPQLYRSMNKAGGEILGNKRLSGKSMAKIINPAESIMMYDSKPWPGDKALAAYTDGHTKFSGPFSIVMAELQKDPFK